MPRSVCIPLLVAALLVGACGGSTPRTRAVYLLLDTSGTYAEEVIKARSIAHYLLGTLSSGDSLGLARIDSASFSEKDVVARVTFDARPSRTHQQKRAFQAQLDRFVAAAAGSAHTDITGGVLQAAEWLEETGASEKFILIFSDLEEDLREGYIRDFGLELRGIGVVALNVTKLRSDQIDPREYQKRLATWRERVESGGGSWRVVNDLERLERILAL